MQNSDPAFSVHHVGIEVQYGETSIEQAGATREF